MKYYIYTLGCKVNSYESEMIQEEFNNHGYIGVEDVKTADIIVINTCTVTNQADAKSRKVIRGARRNNSNAIIVVCGCSAENHKDSLDDLDIDIIIGNKDKSKLCDYIETYKKDRVKISNFYDLQKTEFEDMKILNFKDRTRGFVKIQDGCNNYCAYCIIPFTRGNIRSKDINVAVDEINCLANNGYQEIVLTGIHTGSYGRGKDYDLVDLIREISKNDNLKRIRISSIEATELDEKFMEELKNNNKICNHMHIPIQTGSDHILKLMRRKYNVEEFINKIEELRSIRPDISITTDLIVGFPEESDEDFNTTLETVKRIGFTKVHTFPFSLRNGTLAATYKPVNDKVKDDRVKEMIDLSNILENKYYEKHIGEVVSVLVENDNVGLTDNYIKIKLDKTCKVNTFVDVKIENVDGLDVYGKVM